MSQPVFAVRSHDGITRAWWSGPGVFALLVAAPAWAEPPPPPPAAVVQAAASPSPAAAAPAPPAASPSPSAAAAPAPPAAAAPAPAQTAELVARAMSASRRGDERFDSGDYQGALEEYERAYEWLPVYNVLYNIGAANLRLQRWAAARQAFAAYLELGGSELSPARVREVRGYLEELGRKTATLSLLLNVPDAEVHIDGVRVAPTQIAGLAVEPGEHIVRVSKPGFRPLEQVFQATTGENVRVVLPLTRIGPPGPIAPGALSVAPPPVPPAPAPSEPTPLWLPWTVTGVLAAGWLATAALAVKARHDRDEIEQPGTPEHTIDEARRLHMSLAVASDVLLAATLVSGGISAYLTWWSDEPSADGAAPSGSSRSGVAVGVSGHF